MDKTALVRVHHKEYGDGEVIKNTSVSIYVQFHGKRMIFPYPEAFDKGYLIVLDTSESIGEGVQEDAEVLMPEDIKHRIVVIKINQRYEDNMSPEDLYNAVRGIWKASKERAEKAEYVFGVYQSVIVAVYKPTEWFICREAKDKLPRKDIVLSDKNENRIFFEDRSFEQGLPPDENQEFYLGKSIRSLTMNKNSQNPITYLNPAVHSSDPKSIDPDREITLDAADHISYKKIYEAINATVGTNYSGWMKAGWPDGKQEYPFWIWFPKLAETKDGKLVSAAFDCVNTISDDWNEVIYEDLKDTPPEIDGNWKTSPVLIFAKEPRGGPYIFRGVYVRDTQRSRYKHHVVIRIATRVKLIGQPSERIEILDDIRA